MKKPGCFVFPVLCLLSFFSGKAQNFQTVQIGRQTWMAENLDVVTFRNGDTIAQVLSISEWEMADKAKKAACCVYEFNTSSGPKFGKLYNWYAVNDPRGLAPFGWHIPDSKEWKVLTDYLGGWKGAVMRLKHSQAWLDGGNGSNESGFSALPGGRLTRYNHDAYTFVGAGRWGYWWTSTKFTSKTAKARSIHANGTFQWLDWDKGEGMSVRCVKDDW